jgi:hypothetical protein
VKLRFTDASLCDKPTPVKIEEFSSTLSILERVGITLLSDPT